MEPQTQIIEAKSERARVGKSGVAVAVSASLDAMMMAGRKLLERLGAHVMEGAAIVDLPELGGSQKIRDSGLPLFTLVDFSGH